MPEMRRTANCEHFLKYIRMNHVVYILTNEHEYMKGMMLAAACGASQLPNIKLDHVQHCQALLV